MRTNVTSQPNSKLKALRKETVRGGIDKKKHIPEKPKQKSMKYTKPEIKNKTQKIEEERPKSKFGRRSRTPIRAEKEKSAVNKQASKKIKNNKKSKSPIRSVKNKNDDLDMSLDKEDLFSKLNELTQMNKEHERLKNTKSEAKLAVSPTPSPRKEKREKKKLRNFLLIKSQRIKKEEISR